MFGKVNLGCVKTANAEMEYAVFGKGEKVFVIIPGLSIKSVIESASAVARAYKAFGETHTVYLFDRRKDVNEGLTLNDMAEDIIDSMKALGLSRADVFGTSQGGMIAQLIAIKEPELVKNLVLGSSAARENGYARNVISQWIELALENESKKLAESFVEKLYSEKFVRKYGSFIIKMTSSCTEDELKRFIILAESCDGFDILSSLEKIKCPVLVLGAKEDKVLTGKASEEIAEKLGCEIYMYPAPYSHAVYDEAPDFKDRILEFLNK